jgi:hypothetical protein
MGKEGLQRRHPGRVLVFFFHDGGHVVGGGLLRAVHGSKFGLPRGERVAVGREGVSSQVKRRGKKKAKGVVRLTSHLE